MPIQPAPAYPLQPLFIGRHLAAWPGTNAFGHSTDQISTEGHIAARMLLSDSEIRISGFEIPMQLYLDIDGVLLTKHGALSEGAEIFLQWCVGYHDPFWISTRTRDGSIRGALRAFHNLLDAELVGAIRPRRWETLKTECLPIGSHNWLWLDDEILHAERAVLASNDALDHFIQVNVDREPFALIKLKEALSSI